MSHPRQKQNSIHNSGIFAKIRNRKLRNILESSIDSRKKSSAKSQTEEKHLNGCHHSGYKLMADRNQFTFRTLEVLKKPGQGLGLYLREGNGIDRVDGVFISRIAPDGAVATSVRRDLLQRGYATSNKPIAGDHNSGNYCMSPASDSINVVPILQTGDEIYAINSNAVVGRRLEDVVVNMSIQKKLVLTIRRPQSKQSTNEFNNNLDELPQTSTSLSSLTAGSSTPQPINSPPLSTQLVSNFNYHRDYLRNVASPSDNMRSAVDFERLRPFSAGASIMNSHSLESGPSSRVMDRLRQMDGINMEEGFKDRFDTTQHNNNLVFQKRIDDFKERQLMQQLFYRTKYLKSDDQQILNSNEIPVISSTTSMLTNNSNNNDSNNNNNNMIVSFTDESLDSGLSSDHSGLCRLSLSDASSVAGVSSVAQPHHSSSSAHQQAICLEPTKTREQCSNSTDASRVVSERLIASRKERFTDDDEAELDLVVENKKTTKNSINLSLLYNYDIIFGNGLNYENYDNDDDGDDGDYDDDDDDIDVECGCGKCVGCRRKSKFKREFELNQFIAKYNQMSNNKSIQPNYFTLSCYQHLTHNHPLHQNVLHPIKAMQCPPPSEFQPPQKHHNHQVPSPILEDLSQFSLKPFANRKDNFHHWLNTGIPQTLHRPISAYEDNRGRTNRRGRCDFDLDYRHPDVDKKQSSMSMHRPDNNNLFNYDHHHNLVPISLFHDHLVQKDGYDFPQKQLASCNPPHSYHHHKHHHHHQLRKSEDNDDDDDDDDDDDLGAVLRRYLIKRRRNSDAGSERTKELENGQAMEAYDWLQHCRSAIDRTSTEPYQVHQWRRNISNQSSNEHF